MGQMNHSCFCGALLRDKLLLLPICSHYGANIKKVLRATLWQTLCNSVVHLF